MASLAPNEPAALKVFGIPELAYIICAVIRKRDNVNLMQVCRELFYSILPFIWEEVDGPDLLVSLIPGGGAVSYGYELPPYVVMQLPGSLDLSRFNIYAPHVKRLTLSHIHVDEYDDWERFHSCTRSIDLLPNLETVYFPASCLSEPMENVGRVEPDSVKWAIAFLSTSLRAIVQAPPKVSLLARDSCPLWLGFDLYNSLMTSVAQKCSRLRSLSVLPAHVKSTGPSSRWGYVPAEQISFSCDSPEAYSNFLQLRNLTSLSISSAMLCPEGLAALSSLPKLESLCVVGWERDRQAYCENLHLSTDAFPALSHLKLSRLTWDTIYNLCNAKPLIDRLQIMTITSPPDQHVFPDDVMIKDISDIILLLATHSSNITTLAVHDYGSHRFFPGVLDNWDRLPLVSLHLGWSVIRYCEIEGLCSILSCLPLLEDLQLSMTQDPFKLKQMRKFVELLPRLRHIQIPVKWGSITELTEADFTPCRSQSNSPLYVKSNFYLPEFQEEGARQLARYLSILRPTAPVVCESFSTFTYIGEQPKDMINAELVSHFQIGLQ